MSPPKRLNLPKTVKANLGNPFSWYSDNENILVRMLPKNRAVLLNEKKIYQQAHCFKCNRHNSQNRTYQDLLKNKMDEANFENILTAELYTVNLEAKII
jgi:hypothetical protein